jgi:hypothetical protein
MGELIYLDQHRRRRPRKRGRTFGRPAKVVVMPRQLRFEDAPIPTGTTVRYNPELTWR